MTDHPKPTTGAEESGGAGMFASPLLYAELQKKGRTFAQLAQELETAIPAQKYDELETRFNQCMAANAVAAQSHAAMARRGRRR